MPSDNANDMEGKLQHLMACALREFFEAQPCQYGAGTAIGAFLAAMQAQAKTADCLAGREELQKQFAEKAEAALKEQIAHLSRDIGQLQGDLAQTRKNLDIARKSLQERTLLLERLEQEREQLLASRPGSPRESLE